MTRRRGSAKMLSWRRLRLSPKPAGPRSTRHTAATRGASSTCRCAEPRFGKDAFREAPAAQSEASRATFDPTYGRYTWGKLEILALRDEAIARWGPRFSLRRFHEAMLELGAPPLGTLGDALEPV